MLNPQWLRSFSAVADAGSFTRAAEGLGLTQAAVSQHVAALEDEFGPLLLRRPRRLDLTPAGRALLACHAEILAAERRLRTRLHEDDPHQGEISLITPGSLGLALYPLLLDLQQAEPGLSVRHRFAPDSEVCEAVLADRFELGVLTLKPDDPRLAARLFAEEPLELVLPAAAPMGGWDDLARLGMIDHPDGRAMSTRLLSRYFPGNPGVRSLPVRGYVNQIGLILEPVARGLGFAVLPRHARQAFARQEAIRVLEGGPPVLDSLWLIHRAEWPLSARAAHALDFLRQRM